MHFRNIKELARLLQQQENKSLTVEEQDRLVAMEAQDKELARMLQERERAKAKRAKERARQRKLAAQKQQDELAAGGGGSDQPESLSPSHSRTQSDPAQLLEPYTDPVDLIPNQSYQQNGSNKIMSQSMVSSVGNHGQQNSISSSHSQDSTAGDHRHNYYRDSMQMYVNDENYSNPIDLIKSTAHHQHQSSSAAVNVKKQTGSYRRDTDDIYNLPVDDTRIGAAGGGGSIDSNNGPMRPKNLDIRGAHRPSGQKLVVSLFFFRFIFNYEQFFFCLVDYHHIYQCLKV